MLLSARAISRHYGSVVALDRVDLEIASGEIVALAGENGSGKSTLMKILAGALAPDAGEIFSEDVACAFRRPHDALQRGIALVSQEITSVPALTVAENVMMTRLPHPWHRFSRRVLARESLPFLEQVGIDCDPLATFESLRLADRELVEVAKALAARPRLLLLDEVTSRLGGEAVSRLFAVVRSLREQGVSTLFVTHRLSEVVDLAERTVVLRDGRLVGLLSRAETTVERLGSIMVGRDLDSFRHRPQLTPGEPVLRLEQLLVQGSRTPLDLTVRAGEIVGLAGLVGAGRTELLETISGIRPSRSGRVVVAGRRVPAGSPAKARKAGIAMVPEDRHQQGLVLTGSVRTNLAMGSWSALRPVRQGQERAFAATAVRRLGIKAQGTDISVSALSGGNQQKVVLGRCLGALPRVLLLDEPTRGIDVGAKAEIYALVGEMLADGMAILMASSEMVELLGLSDRVLVLHERDLMAELTREEATEDRVALLAGGVPSLRAA